MVYCWDATSHWSLASFVHAYSTVPNRWVLNPCFAISKGKKEVKGWIFFCSLCVFVSTSILKAASKCAWWELHFFCPFQSEDREMAPTLTSTEGQLWFHRAVVGKDYEHTLFRRTITENEMTLWKYWNEKSAKEVCAISSSLQHPRVSLAAQGYQEAWAGQFRAGAPCCTVSSNLPTKQTASFRTAAEMKWIHILLCLRRCFIYSVTWPCVPNAEGSCGRWVKFIKVL